MNISPDAIANSRALDRAVERLTMAHTMTMLSLADGKVDFCISMLEAAEPNLLAEAKNAAVMTVLLDTVKFYMRSVQSQAGRLPS